MRNIIFIMLLFVWPIIFLSQESVMASRGYDWLLNNYDQINEKIKSGSDEEVTQVVNKICTIWKNRDGAIGAEVSPLIANAIIYRPNITFTWFEKNEKEFNAWVSRISYTLFTDFIGNQEKGLEDLRLELISSNQKYLEHTKNNQHKLMTEKLIKVLKKTSIRKID